MFTTTNEPFVPLYSSLRSSQLIVTAPGKLYDVARSVSMENIDFETRIITALMNVIVDGTNLDWLRNARFSPVYPLLCVLYLTLRANDSLTNLSHYSSPY